MRNFNYGGDGMDEELENDGEMDEIPEEILEAAQTQIVSQELNQQLLAISINTLESSFFWKFRRFETRIRMIIEMYQIMRELIKDNDSDV